MTEATEATKERERKLDALERKWSNTFAQMLAARERIVEATGGKCGVDGSVQCPHCPGRVHYAVARNGHVHARCTTEGCVAWME